MSVDPATADYRSSANGKTYFFCSSACKATFHKNLEKFVQERSRK